MSSSPSQMWIGQSELATHHRPERPRVPVPSRLDSGLCVPFLHVPFPNSSPPPPQLCTFSAPFQGILPHNHSFESCSKNVYRYWQNLGGLALCGWVSPAPCFLSPCQQRELNYWYLPLANGSHDPVLLILSTRWQQSPEVLWRRPYEIFPCPLALHMPSCPSTGL